MKLNDLMEFDHVVRVNDDGTVTDDLPNERAYWAPTLCDDELDSAEWSLMDGYSGQYRYSGPIMHASEFIGGQMERDILAQPGLYVTLVNYFSDDTEPEGWAVAYREDI